MTHTTLATFAVIVHPDTRKILGISPAFSVGNADAATNYVLVLAKEAFSQFALDYRDGTVWIRLDADTEMDVCRIIVLTRRVVVDGRGNILRAAPQEQHQHANAN